MELAKTASAPRWKLRIFYDGACPICSREMRFLMRLNRDGALDFCDAAASDFDPSAFGITTDTNRFIHGMLPNGTILQGMEVFRRAYAAVGLGWLLAPTGWPLLRPLFDLFYRIFAANRIRISRFFGRRDGACPLT